MFLHDLSDRALNTADKTESGADSILLGQVSGRLEEHIEFTNLEAARKFASDGDSIQRFQMQSGLEIYDRLTKHFDAGTALYEKVILLDGAIIALSITFLGSLSSRFTSAHITQVPHRFWISNVRPERIGFDIKEISDDLFSETELDLKDIRDAVIHSVSAHLEGYLQENRKAGRERVEYYASHKAPRYRPILARIADDKLNVDPDISDKELELLLHKQLSEIEGSLLSEGHEMMNFGKDESPAQYRTRLASYLDKVDDLKKSDLANYVFHRKVILDILQKAIQRGANGKYAREDLIHELIMPMRKTSNEIRLDSWPDN